MSAVAPGVVAVDLRDLCDPAHPADGGSGGVGVDRSWLRAQVADLSHAELAVVLAASDMPTSRRVPVEVAQAWEYACDGLARLGLARVAELSELDRANNVRRMQVYPRYGRDSTHPAARAARAEIRATARLVWGSHHRAFHAHRVAYLLVQTR